MERNPMSHMDFDLTEATDIELFALQSLHQDRIRRSEYALEDIQVEIGKRKGEV